MENVEQLKKWRTELVELRNGFRRLIDAPDRSDVEEELQTCIESLEHDGYRPIAPHSFRRSVDLIARPYIETDAACIIRRTNKALLSLLNLDLNRRIAGTPLLVFIARGDRQRFVTEFLKLACSDGLYLAQITVRVQPHFEDAVWMHLEGHRIEGRHRQLLGLVWLLKVAEGS